MAAARPALAPLQRLCLTFSPMPATLLLRALAKARMPATTQHVMLSVVIPLYNEEDNIAPLQDELAAALAGRDYELVLVDDCSSDKTLERIKRGPGVRVIEFAKNTGQSAAMYVGINAAQGDTIVLLDGDRQNDPADIP